MSQELEAVFLTVTCRAESRIFIISIHTVRSSIAKVLIGQKKLCASKVYFQPGLICKDPPLDTERVQILDIHLQLEGERGLWGPKQVLQNNHHHCLHKPPSTRLNLLTTRNSRTVFIWYNNSNCLPLSFLFSSVWVFPSITRGLKKGTM